METRMKIAVLGTGMVGHALASKLVTLGHEVMMGARTPDNEKAVAWAAQASSDAQHGTFQDAAHFAELVIVAVNGAIALEAITQTGVAALQGKVLIDVTNPLDFSKGMPPRLIPELINDTSIAEKIQKAVPGARVVKTLNTINCEVMVDPARVSGEHDVFVSGDDATAKATATDILHQFGWTAPIDLGSLSTARGTELMMPIWLRLWAAFKTADFGYRIVVKGR
jgi:8-hydroxy-5-deazaflavin:NADPH oxidoreductase